MVKLGRKSPQGDGFTLPGGRFFIFGLPAFVFVELFRAWPACEFTPPHMSQTLSLGMKSELTKGDVNSSKQAILIRSGVAGVSKGNHFLPRPTSARAALIASLIAKKTDDARKNGGSPTAFDECIPFEFGFP
ncbi:hypothetical protein DY000_02010859 [Brassica cretica]|uniref:Uncharacterized protein n=1 Tax=Brassica cretica TaxID=69181 RepID=A0ABQ7CWC5_BRACR|nr:hypothetical protein DY000_02010859 [Brassica cretica]